KKTVERIIKAKGIEKCKQIQVCFIALNKKGEVGAYALQKGFNYSVCYADDYNKLLDSKFLI
ncbi:hypothetical protein ACSTLG_00425, partial [Vibrio parahaemolyticus]